MLGPRYVLTPYQKKLHEMDYQKHIKRLESIKKPVKKQVVEEKDTVWRRTFSEVRVKHNQFQNNEKILSIDKNNQHLLDKLVKISRNQKPPVTNLKTWNPHPGTLNTFYRKRELERIALENESFARRLISQQGCFNRKRLDQDFEKHQGLVKLVQKVTSPTAENNIKLSPIVSPTNKKKKGFKIKKVKKNKTITETQDTLVTEQTQTKEDHQVERETEVEKIPSTNLNPLSQEVDSTRKLSGKAPSKDADEKQEVNNEENKEQNCESPLDSKRVKIDDAQEGNKDGGSTSRKTSRSKRSGTVQHSKNPTQIKSERRGSGSGDASELRIALSNDKEKSQVNVTERGDKIEKTQESGKNVDGKEAKAEDANEKKEENGQIEKIEAQ